jgi:hypothetical protein
MEGSASNANREGSAIAYRFKRSHFGGRKIGGGDFADEGKRNGCAAIDDV